MVCSLKHQPKSPEEVACIFECANVIVATIGVIGGCSDVVHAAIVSRCSHLFIDEAHHVAAPTWDRFRRVFLPKPILQFTATPFRRDGKHIGGKIVFNYPLQKAQAEGYFKPITFRAIEEFDRSRADAEIARVAVEQLERDLAAGLDHRVMARADTIDRARLIHGVYRDLAPDYCPLLVHSNLPRHETSRMPSLTCAAAHVASWCAWTCWARVSTCPN